MLACDSRPPIQWIQHFLSIALQKNRLKGMFGDIPYRVIGEPKDLHSARAMARAAEEDGRYQFQWWALSLVDARPLGAQGSSKVGKKGSDKGIDGVITFIDSNDGKARRVIVQVKSGHVKAGDIQQLVGTVNQEGAAMGVFITLEEPTAPMRAEALRAGQYHSEIWGKDYPRIQILTVGDLLRGEEINMPPQLASYKQAQRVRQVEEAQGALDLGG